jgi:hypothetical protein
MRNVRKLSYSVWSVTIALWALGGIGLLMSKSFQRTGATLLIMGFLGLSLLFLLYATNVRRIVKKKLSSREAKFCTLVASQLSATFFLVFTAGISGVMNYYGIIGLALFAYVKAITGYLLIAVFISFWLAVSFFLFGGYLLRRARLGQK